MTWPQKPCCVLFVSHVHMYVYLIRTVWYWHLNVADLLMLVILWRVLIRHDLISFMTQCQDECRSLSGPVWEFGRWLRFKSVSVRTLYLLTTTFSIRFFPTFAPSHPTNIYCKRADQNRFVKTKKIERDIAGQISSVLPSRPLRAPLMNSFQLSFLTAWFSCSFRSDLRPFA